MQNQNGDGDGMRSDAPTRPLASALQQAPSLSALDRSVLLTVLYADLFDFALSYDELFRRLVAIPSDPARVEAAIARLCDGFLATVDEYIVWIGREHLVDMRRRRRDACAPLWQAAARYGRWLARVPFVEMVAVSGSLAVANAHQKSDIDLFCITQSKRLWLSRLFIVPLSKLTRRFPGRFPLYLCPNYIVTTDALEVVEHNLFTAHEVVQAVPIWGRLVFQRFLDENQWVRRFLPHQSMTTPEREPPAPHRPLVTRAIEGLLGGRLGDALDVTAHRLFVTFYRRRALRSGWPWPALAAAYRRSRYTVPEGGYVRVVRRLFGELVHDRLGGVVTLPELDALFPDVPAEKASCYDWNGLFMGDYGREKRRGSEIVLDI